jgi:hypothetical protein
MDNPDRLLTRREAAEWVRAELGRPLTFSTLTKLCALGEGPPAFEVWGRRMLYRKADLQAWALARGKPVAADAGR